MIGNEEFAIQGRSLPFDAESTVAMGFKSQLAQTYTISIDHVDGLFLNGQVVYLKDNVTNTTQNLSENPYTFATEAGTFNGRFEIVYQNPLHTAAPAWSGDTVVVYKHNQDVVIHSGTTTMKEIRIYDTRGRLLVEKKNIGVAEIKINIGTTQELLIVKITSDANETITKKLIH